MYIPHFRDHGAEGGGGGAGGMGSMCPLNIFLKNYKKLVRKSVLCQYRVTNVPPPISKVAPPSLHFKPNQSERNTLRSFDGIPAGILLGWGGGRGGMEVDYLKPKHSFSGRTVFRNSLCPRQIFTFLGY